jgi:hypothetical protein
LVVGGDGFGHLRLVAVELGVTERIDVLTLDESGCVLEQARRLLAQVGVRHCVLLLLLG